MVRWFSRALLACTAALSFPAVAQPLQGFADLHTHPMSHLGFGGVVMAGAPDDSTPMLRWNWVCGTSFEPAGSISQSLGSCNAVHGGPGIDNPCGDLIRSAIIDNVERRYVHEFPNPGVLGEVADHPHTGYPNFAWWPHSSSVTHQQMRWEWIRRAFEGGQRVMVALAVNNSLLAKAGNAPGLVDDRASVLNQLREIDAFALRHSDFMAVARSSAELRSIVEGGRLAVVMGVETDDFGNLSRRANFGGETITAATINAEIDALFAAGARYILPVHFSNSLLGGYAINDDLFVLNSKEYVDAYPSIVETCGQGVLFNVDRAPLNDAQVIALRSRDLGRVIDHQPVWPVADAGCGHQNSLGLTSLGTSALRHMMDLGMIIDVDHMSRRMVDGVVGLARSRNYPLNSGHNGPMATTCTSSVDHPDACNENARTAAQYQAIRELGGMVGLGHGGGATNFVRTYRQVHEAMGNRPVGIGTDVNGLEAMPGPDAAAVVTYDTAFPRFNFPSGRAWDLNIDGFAHYGLFPDYIRAWQASPTATNRITPQELESFMSSAEQFRRMWSRSEQRSAGAPFSGTVIRSTVFCTHAGATVIPGDYNGDGATDLACRDSRFLWVDLANRFGALDGAPDLPTVETSFCTGASDRLLTGDFNGDGRTDLLCQSSTGLRQARPSVTGAFGGTLPFVSTVFCTHPGATLRSADVNGDGRDDLVCTDPAFGAWIEWADANGNFQGTPDDVLSASTFCPAGGTLHLADVNGDGRTDLICRQGTTLRVKLVLTTGTVSTSTRVTTSVYCTHPGAVGFFKDLNGDGRADWLCRDATGTMWADYADPSGRFLGATWSRDTGFCETAGSQLSFLDVNGDGRTDALCKSSSDVQVRYATSAGTL